MAAAVNYRIKKLDVHTQLPEFGVIPFIGSTSSGKTSLMLDILYHIRHKFQRVIAICGSKDTEAEFKEHMSDLLIWDKFDADRLNAIYEEQERLVFLGTPKPLLVILDDFMYQARNIQKGEILNRIFMNGRHARILFFVSMQYAKCLTPSMRQQARMIFMMAERNPNNRMRLFEAFNTCFSSFTEFDALMMALTRGYQAMVLSNMASASNDVVDNVFWYKATLGRRFRVAEGGLMWDIHRKKYDPMYFVRKSMPGPNATRVAAPKGSKRGVSVQIIR